MEKFLENLQKSAVDPALIKYIKKHYNLNAKDDELNYLLHCAKVYTDKISFAKRLRSVNMYKQRRLIWTKKGPFYLYKIFSLYKDDEIFKIGNPKFSHQDPIRRLYTYDNKIREEYALKGRLTITLSNKKDWTSLQKSLYITRCRLFRREFNTELSIKAEETSSPTSSAMV